MVSSLAASWPTARRSLLRLHSPHEGTHELPINLGSDGIEIDVLSGQELTSVLYPIDSGRLDINLLETSRCELAAIFVFFESTRNAANPEKHALTNCPLRG